MRRVIMMTLSCVGLIAAVTPLGWWATHRPGGGPAFGSASAAALAVPSPSPSVAPGSRPPTASPAPRAAVAVPAELTVPSVQISAPVLSVGVSSDGQLALPEVVSQVGWYRWGAAPGSGQGSVVVAGHVDSAVQGDGAMFRLREVARGAVVTLRARDGRVFTYRVVAREEFAKSVLPVARIFGRTGASRLTLVTCGGAFDASTRSYDDNIVVTAVPVP